MTPEAFLLMRPKSRCLVTTFRCPGWNDKTVILLSVTAQTTGAVMGTFIKPYSDGEQEFVYFWHDEVEPL